MMKKFFQITKHTDCEITSFLEKNRKEGNYLVKVVGNYFHFDKRSDDRPVCALSLYAHGREVSTELQVRENLVFLRQKGWDCICVGRPETMDDRRRHVYLRAEIDNPETLIPDEESEKKAQRRGKRKALSNLILCLLYFTSFFLLISHSAAKVTSSNSYIFSFALLFVFLAVCTVYSVGAFIERFFKRIKKPLLDFSTRLVFWFLLAFAIFLLLDSFLSEKKSSQSVKIGSSSYKLYSDEIPLTLDDLGGSTDGSYRTTTASESKSILASYSSYFDESFGLEAGESVYDEAKMNEVSFVSYSIYTSSSDTLRSIVENEIYPYSNRTEVSVPGADVAFLSSSAYLIRKNDSIMVVKSGYTLPQTALEKLVSLM